MIPANYNENLFHKKYQRAIAQKWYTTTMLCTYNSGNYEGKKLRRWEWRPAYNSNHLFKMQWFKCLA